MKNKMQDVRDHLIAQMEAIREADAKDSKALQAELDKGRVLSEIGKVLTDTARVEVEAMKVFEGRTAGTGFIPLESTPPAKPALPNVRN